MTSVPAFAISDELRTIVSFLSPDPADHRTYLYTEPADLLLPALHRSHELRAWIMTLQPSAAPAGYRVRTAQDMCRIIEAGLAAQDPLK